MPSDTGETLSNEELDAETAALLPERQALSRIGIGAEGVDNFATVINEATAMNIASDDSIAVADADQIVIISQTDQD